MILLKDEKSEVKARLRRTLEAMASGVILEDVLKRTTGLLNHHRQLTADEALMEFADIVHGYHHAVPFLRGRDAVSHGV